MELAVARTFLCRDEDDTVGAARAINSRSRTVFQNVERLDVVRVDVRQVTTRHTVDDNQRTRTGSTRGHATDLDARLVVRVTGSRVGDAHAGHLALDHHRRVNAGHSCKILGRDMRDGRGQLLLVHRTITDDHHLVELVALLTHRHVDGCAAVDSLRRALISYIRELQRGRGRHT